MLGETKQLFLGNTVKGANTAAAATLYLYLTINEHSLKKKLAAGMAAIFMIKHGYILSGMNMGAIKKLAMWRVCLISKDVRGKGDAMRTVQ